MKSRLQVKERKNENPRRFKTNIEIYRTTRDRLSNRAKHRETYDSFINRLLDLEERSS